MKKRHYFIDKTLDIKNILHDITESTHIHQIKDILRLAMGEEIVITDGQGSGGIFEIIEIDKKEIKTKKLQILEKKNNTGTTLACAVLKNDNFELVIQKATELGVSDIIPLLTDRTVKTGYKINRIEKIISESTEQSEQFSMPVFHTSKTFEEFIKSVDKENTYLLDPSGINYKDIIHTKNKSRTIIVGPEGGWSENEITLAKDQNISIVSIGNTILRAETAAIIGCFWANN